VLFPRDVTGCAYTATIGSSNSTPVAIPAVIDTAARTGKANGVFIHTRQLAAADTNLPFHLNVDCPGSTLWAVVNADGTLARGAGVTGAAAIGTGIYEVTFDRDLRGCTYVATPGGPTATTILPQALAFTASGHNSASGVYVETKAPAGGLTAFPFHLSVRCPEATAAVVASNGTLARGFHATGVTKLSAGIYEVRFDYDVRSCGLIAAVGDTANGLVFFPGIIATASGQLGPNNVRVETRSSQTGVSEDRPFHLVLRGCPPPNPTPQLVVDLSTGTKLRTRWRLSQLTGSWRIAGTTNAPATVAITITGASRVVRRSVTSNGAFATTVVLPRNWVPGVFNLRVVATHPGFVAGEAQASFPAQAPKEGVVDRAFFSAIRGGPPATSFRNRGNPVRRIFVRFHFAALPKRGRPLRVFWFRPGGALFAVVGKPRTSTVDSFVFQTPGLVPGRWKAVLRSGAITVKQLTVRVG
jgi:hypothetical protein